MMHNNSDVLIVGAGHAGAQAAIALRQVGDAGSVRLVSEELDLPYERPPLSKGYLTGEKTGDIAARTFSLVYLRNGAVIALDCVNAVKDYVQGRALATSQARVDRSALADTNIPLKACHVLR